MGSAKVVHGDVVGPKRPRFYGRLGTRLTRICGAISIRLWNFYPTEIDNSNGRVTWALGFSFSLSGLSFVQQAISSKHRSLLFSGISNGVSSSHNMDWLKGPGIGNKHWFKWYSCQSSYMICFCMPECILRPCAIVCFWWLTNTGWARYEVNVSALRPPFCYFIIEYALFAALEVFRLSQLLDLYLWRVKYPSYCTSILLGVVGELVL